MHCGSVLKWIFWWHEKNGQQMFSNKILSLLWCLFLKDTDFQCIRLAEFIRMVGTLSGSQRRAILWKNEKFVKQIKRTLKYPCTKKDKFNWISKANHSRIGFVSLSFVIGLENSHHPLNQSDANRHFPTLTFTSSPDWFSVMFSFSLIGLDRYFGSALRIH